MLPLSGFALCWPLFMCWPRPVVSPSLCCPCCVAFASLPSLCDAAANDTAGAPSARHHARDTAPPFPPAFWDAMRCHPCLVFCLVCSLFSSLFFFYLIFFFLLCLPVTAPFLSQVHRDPLPPANTRGGEAAMTLQPPASPLKPHLRCCRCCIPLVVLPSFFLFVLR
jgi:hypothetical protein